MEKYIVCPHCGNRMKDYALAKALRDGVGMVEKIGNSLSPYLYRYVGKSSGVKFFDDMLGKAGDKLAARKELVSHTIICDKCKRKFQAK